MKKNIVLVGLGLLLGLPTTPVLAANYFATQMYPGAPELKKGDCITVTKPYEHGIVAGQFVDLKLEGITITTRGEHGTGVWGDCRNDLAITNSQIFTEDEGRGVMLMKKSVGKISGTKIVTQKDKGMGVFANESKAKLTKTTVLTNGKDAYGTAAASYAALEIHDSHIQTEGAKAYALFVDVGSSAAAQNTDFYTKGEGAHGVVVNDQSQAKLKECSVLLMGRGETHGLEVNKGSEFQGDKMEFIVVSNEAAVGINAAANSSVELKNSSIGLTGTQRTFYKIDKSSVSLENVKHEEGDVFGLSTGDKLLDIKNDGRFQVKSSTLQGDIYCGGNEASEDKPSAIVWGAASKWTGAIYTKETGATSPTANLTIDQGAEWQLAAGSESNINLENKGVVNFAGENITASKKLVVAKYVGQPEALLKMKVNVNEASASDQLLTKTALEGASLIELKNTANAGRISSAPLIKAGQQSSASLQLKNPDEVLEGVGYIHAGAWKYGLSKVEDWEGKSAWVLLRGDKLANANHSEKGLTSTGQALVHARLNNSSGQAENKLLTNRLGIYRDRSWRGGFWLSGVMDKQSFAQAAYEQSSQKYNSLALGYDKQLLLGNNALWYGVFAGYGKTNEEVPFGNVKHDSKFAAAYAVFGDKAGFYVNGVLKYNQYKSKLNINTPDNWTRAVLGVNNITGQWQTTGVGMTLLAGKKIALGSQTGSEGWYLAPQIQYTWNKLGSSDYKTNTGITVNTSGVTYKTLRGGLVLGKILNLGKQGTLDIFGDVSWSKDMNSKLNMLISKGQYEAVKNSSSLSYGLGANWQYDTGKFMHFNLQYSPNRDTAKAFTLSLGASFAI